jgi:hypothetical protein
MSFAYASSIQLIFSPYIDFGRKRCSFSYQHFSGRALLVELIPRSFIPMQCFMGKLCLLAGGIAMNIELRKNQQERKKEH